MRSAIVDRPVDPARLLAEVSGSGRGAAVLFVGTVREQNAGRPVTGIEYSAYRGMAERELAAIVEEAAAAYPGVALVVEHRLGRLAIGEASIAIAAAHPHRAAAYDASRRVIEETKRRVPIWKREQYADGTREWVHAGSGRAAPHPEPEAVR
jgi:molybdopterin synthase catalytic subunit